MIAQMIKRGVSCVQSIPNVAFASSELDALAFSMASR